jgi:hypothetical protein
MTPTATHPIVHTTPTLYIMKNYTHIAAAFVVVFATIVSAQLPPVFLSELMINATVGRDKGTWFEFYNPGDQPVNMSNRFLKLGNYNASRSDLGIDGLQATSIKIPVGYVIQPKQYFVVGNNDNVFTNRNVQVDYKYAPHVEMNETFGLVMLTKPDWEINSAYEVYWGLLGAGAGPFRAGASLSYRDVTVVPSKQSNVLGASDYCVSVTVYDGTTGDKGTPNVANVCPSPTASPTRVPTKPLTKGPTKTPTNGPTKNPTKSPLTKVPTNGPMVGPVWTPMTGPSRAPTKNPTKNPTMGPTKSLTKTPLKAPSQSPGKVTDTPHMRPTTATPRAVAGAPVKAPAIASLMPSKSPVVQATMVPTLKLKQCGMFGWRIVCFRTKCGIVGRSLGWCKK